MTKHNLDHQWQAQFKEDWRRAVLYDTNLTMGAKAVAMATLVDYNRDDPQHVGTSWNKAKTLAEKMGCGESTVLRAWKALRDAGYLHSLGRMAGGRSVYIQRFDMPEEPLDLSFDDEQIGQNDISVEEEIGQNDISISQNDISVYQNEPTDRSNRPDRSVKMTAQIGQNDRADRSNRQLEQEELNKGIQQKEQNNLFVPDPDDPFVYDPDSSVPQWQQRVEHHTRRLTAGQGQEADEGDYVPGTQYTDWVQPQDEENPPF